MAKEIIILSLSAGNQVTDQEVTVAFWFPVPAGQQIPQPGVTSLYRGASAAEIAALKAGAVVEQIYSTQYPNTFTLAQIQNALQTAYTEVQTAFSALPNPNLFYGAFFDGVTWNAAIGLTSGFVPNAQFGVSLPVAQGDNTLIAGVPKQVIAIEQMIITAVGAVTVQVKDGTTVIGAFQFPASGGTYPLDNTGVPWFVSSPGNSIVVNLSAAVQCAISGYFQQS